MFEKLKVKSDFTKNVLTLMTGTIVAQAIPIAISPILTRLYTPENFGMFALYMSVASLLATFATGRYELAIMLPKKNEDAMNILFFSIVISFCISFFSFLIVFFFNENIIIFLGNDSLATWLYVIPMSVLVTGLYQSFNYWINRGNKYKTLAVSRVTQSMTTGGANLGFGAYGYGTSGLIVGSVLGQLFATSVLASASWKTVQQYLKYIDKLKIISLIKKYKKFPLLNLPNALVDSLRMSGISVLIAKYFSTAILGQFSLAWKMVQVPIVLVGGSLAQVFFQKISNSKRNDLYRIIIKYIQRSSLIAFPIFTIIFLFSEDIFKFVFGEEWGLAGASASIMAPWLFVNFVTSPLVSVMLVLNKQELVLIFSLFYAGVPLCIIVLFNTISFIKVLEYITLSMSIMLLFFSLVIVFYAKKEKVN